MRKTIEYINALSTPEFSRLAVGVSAVAGIAATTMLWILS